MFNVGFKDLIEKCEEYFGKGVTRLGVAIIGLAVLLFAISFAVSSSVYPMALWIGGLITGNPMAGQAWNGIATIVTTIWVVVVVALIVTLFQFRYQFMVAIDQQERAGRAIGNVEAFQAKLRAALRDSPETAGPEILKILDELTADDEKAAAKAAPRTKMISSLGEKDHPEAGS